jgi:hypothetical protein
VPGKRAAYNGFLTPEAFLTISRLKNTPPELNHSEKNFIFVLYSSATLQPRGVVLFFCL